MIAERAQVKRMLLPVDSQLNVHMPFLMQNQEASHSENQLLSKQKVLGLGSGQEGQFLKLLFLKATYHH